ncbi:MAG: carotenoid oxygenase family protein [Mycobacteriales bacterium]|nr:carotenoid oxygenase family protein [Mycobacteriales bacterium]
MTAVQVSAPLSTLPATDDHPYRSGAWQPNLAEWDATDLEVIEGDIPTDLEGVYLRNTENPVHPSIGVYHPFDGDGMLHQLHLADGTASYRNRFVRTAGFLAEQEAGGPLWTGMLDMPANSLRPDGWGARTRMKDASSTDVVVHNGQALTSFWMCGELYAHDRLTLEPRGTLPWVPEEGISAHTKVDERTGEMLVFNYSKQAPYMHYGVVSAAGELVHWIDVPLPGPRLPHDMAFTECYSILNDHPLFWDPQLLTSDIHLPRFYPDLPMRLAVVPRFGRTEDIRWFECEATYVLHWINAYEDGDEIVLDGFFQGNPAPRRQAGDDEWKAFYRHIDLNRLEARPRRYRLNLVTGAVKEEDLSDRYMEFGMINGGHGGRPYRYAYCATGVPGMFAFDGLVKQDMVTGAEQRVSFGEGRIGSEAPFAPRTGSTAEDDGYLVTFVSDLTTDTSEAVLLDARDLSTVCRLRLPHRISSGTHSFWSPTSGRP